MLDIAGAVGAGIAWAGRAVTQGPVVYMVAEGASGIKARVRAWERYHNQKMINVHFVPVAVQATGPAWDTYIELVKSYEPVLAIIDTQARATVGMDENSATEMGLFVESMERLRAATGACTVPVHHRGLQGQQGRGSTAVRGALQTELDVTKMPGGMIVVTTLKQKDHAEADPVVFKLSPLAAPGVDGFMDPGSPPAIDGGAVLVWQREAGALSVEVPEERLTGVAGRAAEAVATLFGGAGATKAEIKTVLTSRTLKGERNSYYIGSLATFYRIWSLLLTHRAIGKIHGTQGWRHVPIEQRNDMTQPVTDEDGKGGFYVPTVSVS
jgi:hypothetical protein